MPTKAQMADELALLRAQLEAANPDEDMEIAEDPMGLEDEGLASDTRIHVDLFLAEAGAGEDGTVVDGYRATDDSKGKLAFAHRWLFEEFNLQAVKDQYGGGKWSFRMKHPNGSLIKSKTVLIEGPPKTAMAEGEDPRSFAETVQDTQALMLETLQELRAGPPVGQSVDPINMALSIVGAFQSVLAPMQTALLKQGKNEPDFGELVTIFKQGVEMGKMSTPAEADPMSAVLAATLPPLLSVIGGNAQAPPSSPLDVLTNPPPGPSVLEGAGNGNPPARPGWDMLISGYVPTLLSWARKDADVDLRAAFVCDELPAEAEALLLVELQKGPDFLAEFLALHPEAKPWESWIKSFWVAVANQYEWGAEGLGPHPFPPETAPPVGVDQEAPPAESVEVGTLPEAGDAKDGSSFS